MNIFPMIQPPENSGGAVQALPLARETAWDYENDVPVFRRGGPVAVIGKEAVKVWMQTCWLWPGGRVQRPRQ